MEKEEQKGISVTIAKSAAKLKLLAMFLQDYDPNSFDLEPEQIHGLGDMLFDIGQELGDWDGGDFDCDMSSRLVSAKLRTLESVGCVATQ